jgi:hypothetical protein
MRVTRRLTNGLLVLALGLSPLLMPLPAHAQTFQFTFFWTARELTFTDETVTVTVTNNITNKIGGKGEVIDTYRITLGDQRIEVTEKHEARDYTFVITGTQTMRLEGIDRGFWAGNYGPIMTVTSAPLQAVTEPPAEPTESPVIEPEVVIPPPPTVTETKEIAESVIDAYSAFWIQYGLNEDDYSQDHRVITYKWIKSQYDALIAERKIGKSLTSALAMRSQVRVIEAAYLAGDLQKNPAPRPAPSPTPEPSPEPSPEPTPEPSPEPQPEPTPVPEPQTSSPAPIVPTPLPSLPEAPKPVEPSPQPPIIEPAPKPVPPVVSSSPEPTASPEPVLPTPEPTPLPGPSTESPQPVTPPTRLPLPTPSPVLTETPLAPPVIIAPDQTTESEEIAQSSSTSSEVIEVPEETEPETVSGAVQAISAVISAFATAGLDMTPEEREKAQGVVIPSVIAAQVATLAMRRIK